MSTIIKRSLLISSLLLSLSCSLFSQIHASDSQPATSVPAEQPPGQGNPTSNSIDQVEVDYLYTSELITVLYPLYGDILDDFTIVTVTNNNDEGVRVVVESEIVGYTSLAIDTVDIEPYETVEIRQNPLLIPEVIDTLDTQKPADFHLRVSLMEGGQKLQLLDQTEATLVYARRDFPWAIEGFTSEEVYNLLAAMVMPNDPAVEDLIREAADYTDSGIIASGYSGASNDEDGKVWDRLEAIWEAETRVYDITYVDTPVDFTPGSVQRIRLPAEVLEQRSGNCIELAILYASAAEALRLEAAILLVPGHAFVAIRTDQEGSNYYPIETTLVGRATFEEAVDSGALEFDEAMAHLEGGEDESYGWVTIWEARQMGINPLPWR
jgi:hypothetical protein